MISLHHFQTHYWYGLTGDFSILNDCQDSYTENQLHKPKIVKISLVKYISTIRACQPSGFELEFNERFKALKYYFILTILSCWMILQISCYTALESWVSDQGQAPKLSSPVTHSAVGALGKIMRGHFCKIMRGHRQRINYLVVPEIIQDSAGESMRPGTTVL